MAIAAVARKRKWRPARSLIRRCSLATWPPLGIKGNGLRLGRSSRRQEVPNAVGHAPSTPSHVPLRLDAGTQLIRLSKVVEEGIAATFDVRRDHERAAIELDNAEYGLEQMIAELSSVLPELARGRRPEPARGEDSERMAA